MVLINQYSILWSGVIILGLAAVFLLRRGFKPRNALILLALVVVLVAGYYLIRPETPTTSEMVRFEEELGQGRYVMLELQSPF